MPQPTDGMPQFYHQHCRAQAIFDNTPDSPDELAFRKGDTLTVLEQNTGNLQGWWLCSLHGKQGICPGNRLRLIPGVYTDSEPRRVHSPHFPADITNDFNSLQGKRKSWHLQQSQMAKNRNDIYDQPPRLSPCPINTPSPLPNDFYDVPPSRPLPIDEIRSRCSPACTSPTSRTPSDTYDTPRPLTNPLTPSSSASSLTSSLSSSNRSSLATMPDYDVPRAFAPRLAPPLSPPPVKHLPLELKSALENLERLENDATCSISKLLGFVGPQWRTRNRLDCTIMEVRLSAVRLRSSLHDLAEFGEGALGNAAKASDRNLAGKLAPLVAALRRSDRLVRDATERLEGAQWSVGALAREEGEERGPDELERLVACARALTEDVRQVASFIQGNGTLLFRRGGEEEEGVVREEVPREEVRHEVEKGFQKGMGEEEGDYSTVEEGGRLQYDSLVRHSERLALAGDDRGVVNFYAALFITHHRQLAEAIDAFLQTVERNQAPRVFLAHGKFVVLSAHKLIHIGDTVHRNVGCREVRERALRCANALSDALAVSVGKTKQAALQFPSVNAVQEMIDAISEVSYSARSLKVCLLEAANPT